MNQRSKLKSTPETKPTMIKLLVGDRLFRVTKSLLIQDDVSYFKSLLSDNWSDKQADKIIICRSEKYFPQILDHLSGKAFKFQEWSLNELRAIAREADYYCLTKFKEEIEDAILKRKRESRIVIKPGELVEIYFNLETMKRVLDDRRRPSFILWQRYDWKCSFPAFNDKSKVLGEKSFDFVVCHSDSQHGVSFYDPGKGEYHPVADYINSSWSSIFKFMADYDSSQTNTKRDDWEPILELDDDDANHSQLPLSNEQVCPTSGADNLLSHQTSSSSSSSSKKDAEKEHRNDETSSSIVKLLVGERVFRVPKDLLLRDKETLFRELVLKEYQNDETIIDFSDRSEQYFPQILNHLKGKPFHPGYWSLSQLKAIAKDAELYMLSRFKSELEELIELRRKNSRMPIDSGHRMEIFFNEELMVKVMLWRRKPGFVVWSGFDHLSSDSSKSPHISFFLYKLGNLMTSVTERNYELLVCCPNGQRHGVSFYDPKKMNFRDISSVANSSKFEDDCEEIIFDTIASYNCDSKRAKNLQILLDVE